eukprot:jgi/Botrbrau1/18754/Bobra.0386s0077.1
MQLEETHREALQTATEAHAKAMQETVEAHVAARGDLVATHMADMAQLEGTLANARGQLREQALELETSQRMLEQHKQQYEGLAQESKAARHSLEAQLREDQKAAQQELARQVTAGKEVVEKLEEHHTLTLAGIRAAAQDAATTASTQFAALQQAKLELQRRFDNREPREEDVEQIMSLKRTVKEQSAQIQAQASQLEQIRAEVLLREDNYNKTFANGGGTGPSVLAVDRALTADEQLSSWMLPKPVRRSSSKQSRASVSRTTSLNGPRPSF